MKIFKLFTVLTALTTISPQPRPVDALGPIAAIELALTAYDTYEVIDKIGEYFQQLSSSEMTYRYDYNNKTGVILVANDKDKGGKDEGWNKHELCSLINVNSGEICKEWRDNPDFKVLECNGNCCYGNEYEEADGLCYHKCKQGYYGSDSRCYPQHDCKDDNPFFAWSCGVREKWGDWAHDKYYERGEGKPFNKYMYPDECKKNNLSANEGKFYIGEKEIKKWTQVTFDYSDSACQNIVNVYLRDRFADKNDLNFTAIADGLTHAPKNHGCSAKRGVKINDKLVVEKQPLYDSYQAINGACSMFLSTELIHTFYINKVQISDTTTKVKEEL